MLRLLLPALIILDPRVPEAVPVAAPDVEFSSNPDAQPTSTPPTSPFPTLECLVETPPAPEHPGFPAGGDYHRWKGVICENSVLIKEDGSVEVKSVVCSDPVFERSTWRALEKMRWATRKIDGSLCAEVGTEVPYPIDYRFE